MFISPAFAQAAGGASMTAQLLPFVLIFGIFYFFLIRPQQKRAKAHRELVMNVVKGDKITTSGGLRGKIVKSVEGADSVQVEIAKDVQVEIVRTMIAAVEKKDA
ncbi:MAG: preprotein translocase subunit YajC [Candidatus Puniceispirillaceae bacterium]